MLVMQVNGNGAFPTEESGRFCDLIFIKPPDYFAIIVHLCHFNFFVPFADDAGTCNGKENGVRPRQLGDLP